MNDLIGSIVPLMPLFMAQIPRISDSHLGHWLICAAAVAVIANQLVTLWRNMTGNLKEQPRPASTYTTKSECETSRKEFNYLLTKLDADIDTKTHSLRMEIKEDIKGIHKRTDAVLSAVAGLSKIIQGDHS